MKLQKKKLMIFFLNGLKLDKSYNGEIDRVVSFPKNEAEIKNYNYYFDRVPKTIVVFGIPKVILGNIPINSFNGHLLLNCITEFQRPTLINSTKEFQFRELKFQKLPSKIPPKWILGYFNENNNFSPNHCHIMAQENSNELITSSRLEILKEFHRRYPSIYLQLFDYNKKNNLSYLELEEK